MPATETPEAAAATLHRQIGDVVDYPLIGRGFRGRQIRHVLMEARRFAERFLTPPTETVTLTLTRAQLAAVRGALDSRVETCRSEAEACEAMAEALADDEARGVYDERASADRWARMASDAASALAVVDAVAATVITDTHAA